MKDLFFTSKFHTKNSLLRIASVPFCNAWPLTQFLPECLPNMTLSNWYPSQMRDALLAGTIDVAMMPVAELLRTPKARILSDAGITCLGQVKSVLLVSKVPCSQIRQLALDAASKTSVTLSLVMLREFYGINPNLVPLNLNVLLHDVDADAFVVIGDRALLFQSTKPWKYQYDLGEWWQEKTGLPFVFAAWVTRKEEKQFFDIVPLLEQARDRGIGAIEQIVSQNGTSLQADHAMLVDYLSRSIRYRIGENERCGMNLFFELARKHELNTVQGMLERINKTIGRSP